MSTNSILTKKLPKPVPVGTSPFYDFRSLIVNSSDSDLTPFSKTIRTKVMTTVLAKVWRLADVDQDGALDSDEFALAMHLINIKLDGYDMPDDLPEHLIPPSKKQGKSYH